MKNIKKVKKLKAFTLVELIVVMVILALLMALVIPNVTKYIDKAGEITAKSEARACLTALQSFAAEKYGSDRLSGSSLLNAINSDKGLDNQNKKSGSSIYEVANVPEAGKITNVTLTGTKITGFVYTNGSVVVEYKSSGTRADGYENGYKVSTKTT